MYRQSKTKNSSYQHKHSGILRIITMAKDKRIQREIQTKSLPGRKKRRDEATPWTSPSDRVWSTKYADTSKINYIGSQFKEDSQDRESQRQQN